MRLWRLHKHVLSESVQTYAFGKLHKPVAFQKFGLALAVPDAISEAINVLLQIK